MLTSRLIKTIAIPTEPGETVTIRKLSHHQLMTAIDDNEERAVDKFKRLGETVKFLPEGSSDAAARAKEEAEKPENKYNRSTVLRYGVTSWSYPDACNEANIDDQDDDWAEFVFGAIIEHSVRSTAEGEASASASPLTSA